MRSAFATALVLLGVVFLAAHSPAAAQADDLARVVSCRGDHGRIDTTIVNRGQSAATYRIETSGVSARQVTVEPNDWARVPLTALGDGGYSTTIRRNGTVVSTDSLTVSCSDEPAAHGPEVTPIVACRNSDGFILVQLVNSHDEPRPYIISFDGVPNRSATVAAHAATVRAITGRPDGTYELTVQSLNDVVATASVEVACDSDQQPDSTIESGSDSLAQVVATDVVAGSYYRQGPPMAVTSDGKIAFVYTALDYENPGARHSLTVCASAACTDPTITPFGDDNPFGGAFTVVPDNSGGIAVVWLTGPHDLMLLHCADSDCVDVEPSVISSGVLLDAFAIAVGPDNDLAVALAHSSGLHVLRCPDVDCSARTSVTVASGDEPYHSVSMDVDAGGRPVILAERSREPDQHFACPNPECTEVAPATYLEPWDFDQPNVAVKPDGTATITALSSEIYVRSCANPDCSGDQAVRVAGPAGIGLPWEISSVLDSAGNPFIAFTVQVDHEHDELWVVACESPTCAEDEPVLVYRSGSLLDRPSVALGPGGDPIISVFEDQDRAQRLLLITQG